VVKKHRKASEVVQLKSDDFKLIKGIGQEFEKRLHTAGIQTYIQLASLTPPDILSKLGNRKSCSISRIEEDDWIGQAHSLITKKEKTRAVIRQHYENFTIEFLLDEKNLARRVHVVHVQTGDADTWKSWEAEQLLDFVTRHTGIHTPTTPKPLTLNPPSPTYPLSKQDSATSAKALSIHPVEVIQKKPDPPSKPDRQNIIKNIHLQDCKITLPGTNQSIRLLPHGQAFVVTLTLDFKSETVPLASYIDCTTQIYAKKLGTNKQLMIGEIQNIIPLGQIPPITIRCSPLAPSVYRLQARINIHPTGTNSKHQSNLLTFLESSLFQVY